ncbi:MAG TPA: (Fe-S)-binding protein [Bacteroidales bacterium]|nr:(Fe-S)-binding protein [Bacteroidales bacterium]
MHHIQFDIFVIPFNIGLYFILIYAVTRCVIWFRDLSRQDKLRLQRGFFGRAFGQSLKEIFFESLLHRKILKSNFRLGYMHMSLAFGWFLLILFGTIEADIFGEKHLNPPYKAIFFRFFNPEYGRTGIEAAYGFLMDFILAFILSGLILAILKRFYSGTVGMKKTTKLRVSDRIALASLWTIFPSRLLAESFTSGIYGTGNFLTGALGTWLSSFLPAETLAYPFWWLYSISLGTFFVLLPITRYMHIPTELFLIFMRNSGIKTGDKEGSFSEVETYSCSSCGMCIDTCQLNSSLGIRNIQSAYLLKAIRNDEDVRPIAHNCLMCGRCDVKCPVGIELTPIRMIQRREQLQPSRNIYNGYFRRKAINDKYDKTTVYNFLPAPGNEKAEVVFFAGCMTHLTPSIKNSMVKILDASGVRYKFIDENGGVCCGRPLMLAGKTKEARELINYNSEAIAATGARILVTSCPICYKVLKESYYLDIEIMHHSQFIKLLIDSEKVKMNFSRKRVVYHSPCELGRGSGVYEEPREVLQHVSILEKTKFDDSNSLCCGGSLGNMKINTRDKRIIATDTVKVMTKTNPDILATACPLCKKTFAMVSDTKVADIAEIVADSINDDVNEAKQTSKRFTPVKELVRL